MASFTINFQAQYPGEHQIGYRSYEETTYTTITVDVDEPGLQSVEIQVPHNLYCADHDLTYDCYVTAFCIDGGYPDSNGDGVPDSVSSTFEVTLLYQEDDCKLATIQCDAVPIASAVIATAGTGYTPGSYVLDLNTGSEIEAATIDVVVGGGGTVDSISITGGNEGLYGVTPPTFVMPASSGEGAGGSGATFTITMGVTELNLEDTTYSSFLPFDGLGSIHNMGVGDSITITADSAETTILDASDEFTVTIPSTYEGNCRCQSCALVNVDATAATSGEGKIIYNQCWDLEGSEALYMITRKLLPTDSFDLGSVDPNSVNVIQGTLDVTPTVTES